MATLSNRIRAHTEKEDGARVLIVQGLRFPTQPSLSSSEACNEIAMFNGCLMVELIAGKLMPFTGMSTLCKAIHSVEYQQNTDDTGYSFTRSLMVELFAGKLLPYTRMSSSCAAIS